MLKFLKPIQSVQQQLTTLPKLYYSHVWITPPSMDGFSYLGISDYAKKHFVRINKIDYQCFPKTLYGINNQEYIKHFVKQTKELKQKNQLPLSQQIQWERFAYKKGESFALMQAIQFDVELQAPIDMRVVEIAWKASYFRYMLSSQYLFKVAVFNPQQLQGLMTEEEYLSSNKMIL